MQNKDPKQAVYNRISQEVKALLEETMPWETRLVSLIALVKEHLSYVSWVGFYRNHEGHLWVGPYQGKLACTHIPPGKGVCGHALKIEKPVLVEDVHAFPGHIACDALARSELVLPVWLRGRLVGVFDIDSHEKSAFDEIDQTNMVELLKALDT